MDFFQAQADAQRRSTLLVVLFAVAVLAIIAAIYGALHFALTLDSPAPFQPELFAGVAVAVLLLVGAGSTYRTLQLRRGGPAVAELLGGRRIAPETTDPDERRLVNVVEEMAIASGVPVPAIYLLDQEPGINAFAAGHTIHDAAIGITRGALERLSRDELQGVVAHEFSHILNGDMRLNLRIMGLLFGILLLAVVGRGLIRVGSSGSRRRRKESGVVQLALLGVVLIVVGYLGVFFGRLIQAAISRQREFLADAAAVQFTRNPAGIAGALKVIGAHVGSTRLENSHAEEASHLLFASRTRSFLGRLLATHPPLVERIRRIDPTFDGHFDKVPLHPQARADAYRALEGERADRAARRDPLDPLGLLKSVGAPTATHLDQAREVIDALPDSLRNAARNLDDAPALIFALIHPSHGEVAEAATAAIREFGGETLLERTRRLEAELRAARAGRFTLLELVLPTLRGLDPEETRALLRTVDTIIHADGQVDAFEKILSQHLALRLGPRTRRRGPGTIHSLLPLRGPIEIVLSALAYSGADDEHDARAAIAAAVQALPADFGTPTLRTPERATPDSFRQALDRLAAGSPGVRRRILAAATNVVAADGVVRPEEAELLQILASALDCPVPPMLNATATAAERPAGDAAASPASGPVSIPGR